MQICWVIGMRVKRYCIMLGGVEFSTAWISLIIGVILIIGKLLRLIKDYAL